MLFSTTVLADKTYEIVVTRFKADVTFDAQNQAMVTLNDLVQTFDGFESRDYFYSSDEQQWVDLIQWRDLDAAKAASKTIMEDPKACSIFALIDETLTSFSHYQHSGHLDKD